MNEQRNEAMQAISELIRDMIAHSFDPSDKVDSECMAYDIYDRLVERGDIRYKHCSKPMKFVCVCYSSPLCDEYKCIVCEKKDHFPHNE